jgi:predicted helicase
MTVLADGIETKDNLSASATAERSCRTSGLERLMVSYLQTDPLYSGLYANVWRWTDWPGRAPLTETCLRVINRCADYAGGSG